MDEEEIKITVKDDELELVTNIDVNKELKQKEANLRAYQLKLQEIYKTGKLEDDKLDTDLEDLEDDPLYDSDDIIKMFGEEEEEYE